MTDTMPDLLPCPFCGGDAALKTRSLDERFAYAELADVACKKCGIGYSIQDAQNPKGGYALYGTGAPKAIAAWNTRTPTPAPNAGAVKVKTHLRLSIARKIGMYGGAYDGPYDARAYTYEHQPGNEPAWGIGRAASNAAKDRAGDYIDGGLSLLRHLSDEGFGVFALNKHDAIETTPDEVIARLVEAGTLVSDWDEWAFQVGGACPDRLVNCMGKLRAALAAAKARQLRT